MRILCLAVLSASLFLLASCSNDGRNMSGVAATGKPLVGVVVTATDAKGKTVTSAATDNGGNYTLYLSELTLPVVITAPYTDINGQPAILSSPVVNWSAITNLTPLTTLITNRAMGKVLSVSPGSGDVSALTADKVNDAHNAVVTTLQPLFNRQGVLQKDLIHDSYKPDGSDKLDRLFDLVRIDPIAGTVSINGTSINIPATGSVDIPSKITTTMLDAIAALDVSPTTTPIQHVIVVIAENHTFDAIYGAYQPKSGNSIRNLLSKGIINADGSPGPHFSLAAQKQASGSMTYTLYPSRTSAYTYLPQPMQTGIFGGNLQSLGTNPDSRFPTTLPNGPFQISKYVPYAITPTSNTLPAIVAATTSTFSADPVHRFFQMWQQTGGTNASMDLFIWVATTVGQGGNTTSDGGATGGTVAISASNPGQGGELMGFYNVNSGDAPLFKNLADNYAMSDNYHQSVMGGTGMNFFSIGTGDSPVYNTNGTLSAPPANQIENPDPTSGTANFYKKDGYQGGSYVNCSDATQPGVSAILGALSTVKRQSNCANGAYYLVNNYNPPYNIDGSLASLGYTSYVYPAQSVTTIGEALSAGKVGWKWYLGGRDSADVTSDMIYPLVRAQVSANPALAGAPSSTIDAVTFSQTQSIVMNLIGDPHLSSKNVMTGPLKSNLVGLATFYNDVTNGTLPAVSFVVPKNMDSGHPGNSSPALAENFINDLINKVKASGQWSSTAIIVTTDEGGGYFDSGAIQMLDFFGDGPRIPMLVISPYAKTGYVDHVYHDHGSILKFIERNWRLKPLSARSRDRLPNPVAKTSDHYMPINGPAIGDLMTMFKF